MKKKESRKIGNLLKKNKFFMFVYRMVFNFIFRTIGLFTPIDKKMILFVSYGGDNIDDSPKVLFDAIKKDPFFSGYKLIWALNYDCKIDGAKVIKIDSFKYFFTALKSRIWITNVNIERGLSFKKRKTIYLNTWHGTPIKKIGNAVKNRNDYNFKNVSILCSDGPYMSDIFVKYFKARPENILSVGRPREDALYNDISAEKILDIKTKLNIPESKKIVLYLPTWRRHIIDVHLNEWPTILGDDYVVLARMHHLDVNRVDNIQNENVIDVTTYPNLHELYLISDYLISDYSSAFFDFGLLGKPVFCFAPDYVDFYSKGYLFFDLKVEIPNGVFETYSDVLLKLKECDYSSESSKTLTFVSKYATKPNKATDCCLDSLKQIIQNKSI